MSKKKRNVSNRGTRTPKNNSTESGESGERLNAQERSKEMYVIPSFMNQCRKKESGCTLQNRTKSQKVYYKKSTDELFSDNHELLFPWDKKFVSDRFRLIEKEDVKELVTTMVKKAHKAFSRMRMKVIKLFHKAIHGQKKKTKLSHKNVRYRLQTRIYNGEKKNVKQYSLRKNT